MLIVMMECFKISVIWFTYCGFMCYAMTINELEDFRNFLEKTSQLDEILVKKGVNPDTDFDDDENISDHAWEDSGKFEGDLILNDRQRRAIVENLVEGLSRNGVKDITKRWPNNELIYYIQKEHFTSDQVQAIQNGIDDLAQASCVKFRPYKRGDRDAVVIQGSRRGCFSNVGYQGRYQVLNLNARHPPGRGCFRHGTVVHELLHSLGFYHMQSSADRDDYVDVKWENIYEPAKNNFRKYNTFSVSDFGVGYDYDSVLHYSRRAFSKNGGDTLVPKQVGASIGQRTGLSDKDTQKLNKMYCDGDSNNFEAADEPIRQPATVKPNPKNKPFEGHGIGYHQGKTVVIKLPAAETLKLTNTPELLLFDRFSKTPQDVSPEAVEGFGAGKDVTYQNKPVTIEDYGPTSKPYTQEQEKLYNIDKYKYDTYNNPDEALFAHNKDHGGEEAYKYYYSPYSYEVLNSPKPDSNGVTENYNKQPNPEDLKKTLQGVYNSGKVSDVINDTFDRLGKIIKTHVYPSQNPDLGIYKINPDYSAYYIPEKKIQSDPEIVNVDKKFRSTLLTHALTGTNKDNNEQLELSGNRYIAKDNPEKEFDASYGTSYPLKKMNVVKDEKLLTPEYATYKNIATKNDYSNLYSSKDLDPTRDDKHALSGYHVPFENEWLDKDDIRKDNEKYDKQKYSSYAPSGPHEYYSSKLTQYQPEDSRGTVFGRSPYGNAYSLFGVLVPLHKKWYNVNYEPQNRTYPAEKPEFSEEYRYKRLS